jgi:phenylacetate-CoA ligase
MRRERYGRCFRRTFQWLKESDFWPYERLRDYQTRRLREMVDHCYQTVPYYHRLFDSLGVKPQDIRTAEDLKVLPILNKEEVRSNVDQFISTRFARSELSRVTTSGTTGAGLEFWHQPTTLEFQWAVWWRFRDRFGLKLSDRHANFGGKPVVPRGQTRPPFWRQNLALHQTYFSSYHLTPENMRHYVEYLDRRRYVYYCGYPSVLSILAEFMVENSLCISRPPRLVATGSETLLLNQARLISQALGCDVVDQYGAAEQICNMSRCPKGLYHEDMEQGIIERDVVETTSEGTTARIIATGLVDMAMPLLRYDIGDLATFVDRKCPCGRASPVAIRLDGRTEAVIRTPDGRRIGRMARVFAEMDNVYESQIVQDRLDHLTVRVVRKSGYGEADEKTFRGKIEDIVGPDVRISFEYVDRIPREANGKLRAVISMLDRVPR